MKIVCAPDSFKESLSAVEAADAMADAIETALPAARIDRCPVGDGGDGTLGSLLAARCGERIETTVSDALGRPVNGAFGLFDDGKTAFIESATAIGLACIERSERDALAASSYGAGELIRRALVLEPDRLIVGIGGSATTDGGCGMAQALGVCFYDRGGSRIDRPLGGGSLLEIARIDIAERTAVGIPISVASDVNNPLTGENGAAAVYGPQKGATPADVARLDEGLCHLADVILHDLGLDVANLPGAGAAGGLGAGLVAFTGATLVPGVETVLEFIGFADRLSGADVCLTGEGRMDAQSLSGKACMGVARSAARAGIPVVALVGEAGPGAAQCLDDGISEIVVIGEGLPREQSIRDARRLLGEAALRVATQYADGDDRMGADG